MVSSVQEFEGIMRSLDRFEERIKAYRTLLNNVILNRPQPAGTDIETTALTEAETETIEALIRGFAARITGGEPARSLWEPLHSYCSKNEQKRDGWAEQNFEYFRWALMWIQKTRTYLDYLGGMNIAEGISINAEAAQPTGSIDGEIYDVALSFAGEDRAHARKIAELIRKENLTVFYDEYEQAALWGKNLYTHLSDLYTNKARYCLMFVSSYYAKKLWTKREREAAQARAFIEHREYILPLKLDDTEVPGIDATVGYIDLRTTSHEEIVQLLLSKLRNNQARAK